MTWVTAITSVVAATQASASGKYNQAVYNRNAQVAEQEAEQLEKQAVFDIQQFDKQFLKLQGETKTNILFSGAELSGSGLRILRQNAEEAELEKDIIDYNAKIGKARKFEEANFARMQGNIARQQARATAIGYYAKAGTSLLRGDYDFGSKNKKSWGSGYPNPSKNY
tara:strand:+ start:43 stop:543 length:501 start_codon:yes stop_codon:yes gene_type:complete